MMENHELLLKGGRILISQNGIIIATYIDLSITVFKFIDDIEESVELF